MVGVWKLESEIRIVTSDNFIDTLTIKNIAKTIKKIDKTNNSPCKIVLKPLVEIRFTKRGELFFERVVKLINSSNSRVSISYEG